MKTCKKCNLEKTIDEFGRNKAKKDGLDIYCKECNALKSRKSKKDKEKIKQYNKEYRLKNSDNLKKSANKYYLDNIDKIKNRTREYSKTEKSKDYKKKYRELNKSYYSEYNSAYRELKKEEMREYFRQYRRSKRNSDTLYKLKDSIRHRITESMKSKGYSKNNSTVHILGCSINYLREYLESKFELWMSWENYGKFNGELNYGWDIDHIIPLSSANNEDELIKLNHFTNLQPLCSYVNRYIKMDNIYENS